jgi:hypothetical protein
VVRGRWRSGPARPQCSSSEIAVFSLAPAWIEERAAAGDDRATVLAGLQSDSHRLLVTLLVGNNVVNAAISSLVTAMLVSRFSEGVAVTVSTVLVGFVVLVFGEIVPKSYGLGHAEAWSLTVARPIRGVELALSPVVVPFGAPTRGLSAAVDGAQEIEEPYTDDGQSLLALCQQLQRPRVAHGVGLEDERGQRLVTGIERDGLDGDAVVRVVDVVAVEGGRELVEDLVGDVDSGHAVSLAVVVSLTVTFSLAVA